MDNSHLTFYIGREVSPPSFDPLNSDSLVNAFHVEQVIGTLVRLSTSGRYEGYLASHWEINKSTSSWDFYLRSNLTCENGTEINPKNYKHGLELILKEFIQHTDIPLLTNLRGYQEFKTRKSNELAGLVVDSKNRISFQFDRLPTSGFLEYLGLPFMGFFCPENFDKEGKWRSNTHVISSAAYRLSPWDGTSEVTLLLRSNWWTLSDSTPKKVTIFRAPPNTDDINTQPTLILAYDSKLTERFQKLNKINLLPTNLSAIVLSTDKKSPFDRIENRIAFKNALGEIRKSKSINIENAIQTESFYPEFSKDKQSITGSSTNQPLSKFKFPNEVVRIYSPGKPSSINDFLRDVTASALKNLNLKATFIESSQAQSSMMALERNQEAWDIRILSVDIGGGIENQLVKFMFCSKLGISFPDPNNQICNLVANYESDFGEEISVPAMSKYLDDFNRIIDEQSAIFPIIKSGRTWLLSPEINPSFLSPSTAVPYFDSVTFK